MVPGRRRASVASAIHGSAEEPRARARRGRATKTFAPTCEAALGDDARRRGAGALPATSISVTAKRGARHHVAARDPGDADGRADDERDAAATARTSRAGCRAERAPAAGARLGDGLSGAARGARLGRGSTRTRRLPGVIAALPRRSASRASSRALALMSPAPSAMTRSPGSHDLARAPRRRCFLSRDVGDARGARARGSPRRAPRPWRPRWAPRPRGRRR